MATCGKCGKDECECITRDETNLYDYPKDPETGEAVYVPEGAHYMNCPHCHEKFDRKDPLQVEKHRHRK